MKYRANLCVLVNIFITDILIFLENNDICQLWKTSRDNSRSHQTLSEKDRQLIYHNGYVL